MRYRCLICCMILILLTLCSPAERVTVYAKSSGESRISIDWGEEKEKLREAVETLDGMGLSPKGLAERLWNLIVGHRDLLEKTGRKLEEATKAPREKVGRELDKATKDVREKAGRELDKAAKKAEEGAKKKAAEELERTVDGMMDNLTGAEG